MLLVALGLGLYLYTHMDDEIRRHVETTLAEKFPQMDVSVGGARLVEGQGIVVYDLDLGEASRVDRSNRLLHIDELALECDASVAKLVNGMPPLRRVVIRRPQLFIQRETGGHFNVESLLPLPTPGEARPPVVIQEALLTFRDQSKPDLPAIVIRDVNLTIAPALKSAEPREAESHKNGPLRIEGTLAGAHLHQARVRAEVNLATGSYHAEVAIDQLQLDRELQHWLSAFAHPTIEGISLQCRASGTVRASGNWQTLEAPETRVDLQVSHGQLQHPRLPRPLTELSCNVTLINDQLQVENLQARSGGAGLAASYRRTGFGANSPAALAARVVQLPLDKSLRRALPPLLQEEWEKYKPEGIVDATVQARFDGEHWTPQAGTLLVGRELSFESDKFRYRLTKGYGQISVVPAADGQPLRLDIDLTGHGGGQPLHIVGQIFDPQPGARGYVTISGENVEIEKEMIEALEEKPREVIASLHPRGKFNFEWRLYRQQLHSKPNTRLQLNLVDLSVNYEKFPYPLSGISGVILAEDNRWTFRELVSPGRREIRCQGYLHPAPVGSELSLRFTGKKVPLDDDLFEALDQHVQHAWTELHPRGHIDFIADVDYRTGQGKPRIHAEIHPRAETASLQPRFFDFLMEQVSGVITYDEGKIDLNQVRAKHGLMTILTNGKGYFSPSGQWQMQLEGLTVDRLPSRGELLSALPEKLSKLIDSLHPTGTFRLDEGVLTFRKDASPMAEVQAEWDVQLGCQQTDLQCGIDLHNIHGAVRLVGSSDGRSAYSTAELDLDSVTFEGVEFTHVRGPLWADESQFLLGKRSSVLTHEPPRALTARVYDGTVAADATVTFHGSPRYSAEARGARVDLARMVTERFGSREEFSGKIDANLRIGGTGRSLYALVGEGDVHIRDADIYESPIVLRLLKTLRYGKIDKTAFNEGNIKFRVEGHHIYLDQLDFLGDVVNLYGKGTTNFEHELNLVFHGVVGRNDYQIPFVKSIVRTTNQQILQMYVTGTMDDPIVQKQAFPGISRLIEQFQTPERQALRTRNVPQR